MAAFLLFAIFILDSTGHSSNFLVSVLLLSSPKNGRCDLVRLQERATGCILAEDAGLRAVQELIVTPSIRKVRATTQTPSRLTALTLSTATSRRKARLTEGLNVGMTTGRCWDYEIGIREDEDIKDYET